MFLKYLHSLYEHDTTSVNYSVQYSYKTNQEVKTQKHYAEWVFIFSNRFGLMRKHVFKRATTLVAHSELGFHEMGFLCF